MAIGLRKPRAELRATAVPFLRLFRFADSRDVLMMICGLCCATIYGIAVPLLGVLLGDIMKPFTTYQKVKSQSGTSTAIPGSIREDAKAAVVDAVIKLGLVGLGVMIASYLLQCTWMIAGERQASRLRELFLRSVLSQDMSWFDENTVGDLTTRLTNDTLLFQEGISEKVSLLAAYLVRLVAGFTIALIKSWQLTLVLLAIVPVFGISGYFIGRTIAAGTCRSQSAYAKSGAVAHETLANMPTVTAYGGQQRAIKKFNDALRSATIENERAAWVTGAAYGIFFALLNGLFALGFWYGSKMAADDADSDANGGEVLNVLFSVCIAAMSVINVGPSLRAIVKARAAATNLFAVINFSPKIRSGCEKPAEITGELCFSGVSFAYPSRPNTVVLSSFSLTIEAGQTIALVGTSGSGKSTVIQLLERFYEPSAGGTITLDGVPIETLSLEWLRSKLGLVGQQPILFDSTIEENIRFGAPADMEITMEQIQNACKISNAHGFITQLPRGYNSRVGKRGAMLSGGQKQRIAIARALIRNPKILLLDEATSALDSESEKLVQDALDRAAFGRTTLVIAHQLSTIRNADKIVVMSNGSIIETGTHESLIGLGGAYASLVIAQEIEMNKKPEELAESDDEFFAAHATMLQTKWWNPLQQQKPNTRAKIESPRLSIMSEIESQEADQTFEKKLSKAKNIGFMRILKLQAKESPLLFLGILMGSLNGILLPALGAILGQFLSIFANQKKDIHTGALKSVYYLLGIMAANFITFLFQFGCFGVAAERLTKRIRESSFGAMLRQDTAFFDDPRNSTGVLTMRLCEDAERIKEMTGPNAANLLEIFSTVVSSLAISFCFSWQISLVVAACTPLLALGAVLEGKILRGENATEVRLAYEAAGQTACDAIQNIETVKGFGLEATFVQSYLLTIELPLRLGKRRALLGSLGFGYSQAAIFWVYAIVFLAGYFFVFSNNVEAGDMFKSLYTIIFGSIGFGQAVTFGPNVRKAKLAAVAYFELIDREPAIDSYSAEGVTPVDVAGNVKISNGHFAYPQRQDAKIFNGLQLDIKRGTKVAIVGPSGCGKSTVVSILLRLYDLDQGSASLDGMDVRGWQLGYLRRQMAVVTQEPTLFSGTIRENICYGLADEDGAASEENVVSVAQMANVHDFVMLLPERYETNVTNSQLSGGQKQRISIARALIRKPKVLLLDEATSALDSESEKMVQNALDEAAVGCTLITIAHRLATIQNANLILVLKGGKVHEAGTHAELLELGGLYSRLAEKQSLNVV